MPLCYKMWSWVFLERKSTNSFCKFLLVYWIFISFQVILLTCLAMKLSNFATCFSSFKKFVLLRWKEVSFFSQNRSSWTLKNCIIYNKPLRTLFQCLVSALIFFSFSSSIVLFKVRVGIILTKTNNLLCVPGTSRACSKSWQSFANPNNQKTGMHWRTVCRQNKMLHFFNDEHISQILWGFSPLLSFLEKCGKKNWFFFSIGRKNLVCSLIRSSFNKECPACVKITSWNMNGGVPNKLAIIQKYCAGSDIMWIQEHMLSPHNISLLKFSYELTFYFQPAKIGLSDAPPVAWQLFATCILKVRCYLRMITSWLDLPAVSHSSTYIFLQISVMTNRSESLWTQFAN